MKRIAPTPLFPAIEKYRETLRIIEDQQRKQQAKLQLQDDAAGAVGLPIHVEDYDADSEGPEQQEHVRSGRDRR